MLALVAHNNDTFTLLKFYTEGMLNYVDYVCVCVCGWVGGGGGGASNECQNIYFHGEIKKNVSNFLIVVKSALSGAICIDIFISPRKRRFWVVIRRTHIVHFRGKIRNILYAYPSHLLLCWPCHLHLILWRKGRNSG